MRYRTQTRQTLHYFARPHTEVPQGPIDHPSAWSGADLQGSEDWREVLTEAEIDELDTGVAAARYSCKPLQALTPDDLPLPTLRRRIEGWREQLAAGRGFVVIRGIPVDRWDPEDCERFFWTFGRYLGVPGAQNPAGDLLGHVRDQGFDSQEAVRAYRTNTRINFHCDAADVVGLLCLSTAQSGGRSRIASSVTVFNALLAARPDLAPLLFEPFVLDTKAEGGIRHFPIEPCRFEDGNLRTFYHADYFRSASRHPEVDALDARRAALLDLYDTLAEASCLTMDLAPGDLQLLCNHTQVHAREGYVDGADPRHLLRLWLSLEAGGGGHTRTWFNLVRRLGWERVAQGLTLRSIRSRLGAFSRPTGGRSRAGQRAETE